MKHSEFPITDNLIYLNHAAVAHWPKRTADAVQAFAQKNANYGSHHYLDWLKTEKLLRKQLKTLLNVPSTKDIALVKNTSEEISFVAYGLSWSQGDNIVSSIEEFPSNRIPWESLADQGVEFKQSRFNHPPLTWKYSGSEYNKNQSKQINKKYYYFNSYPIDLKVLLHSYYLLNKQLYLPGWIFTPSVLFKNFNTPKIF